MRGRDLLHPLPLFAVLVLVVNDHVLKGWASPTLTGKLSDFAGLFLFQHEEVRARTSRS